MTEFPTDIAEFGVEVVDRLGWLPAEVALHPKKVVIELDLRAPGLTDAIVTALEAAEDDIKEAAEAAYS